MAKLNWLFAWAKENNIDVPIDYEGRADIQKLLELYEEWSKKHRKNHSSTPLTKQEWAIFYKIVGDVKKGDYVAILPNGDMIIPIDTKDRGILVIASGQYGSEKVKAVKSFKDKDYMYDLIERLKDGF